MRTRIRFLCVAPAISCALLAPAAYPQRLYDKSRDERAQQVEKLAKEVQSSAVFEKELRNLSVLIQQDLARHFMEARRSLRANIDTLGTWGDVKLLVDNASSELGKARDFEEDSVKAKQDELKAKIEVAEKELKELRGAEKRAECNAPNQAAKPQVDQVAHFEATPVPCQPDEFLRSLLDEIGQLRPLAEFGEKMLSPQTATKQPTRIDAILNGLDTLTKTYAEYTEKLRKIAEEYKNKPEAKQILLRTALESLHIEEEYLKNVAAIEERQTAEQRDIIEVLNAQRGRWARLNLDQKADKGIYETLHEIGDRESLEDHLLALYEAVAVSARAGTQRKMAELRLAHERHRYSIRKSAVMTSGYEQVVSTGAARLAAYYKGGLKPAEVAQFLHDLATIAIPAVVATR